MDIDAEFAHASSYVRGEDEQSPQYSGVLRGSLNAFRPFWFVQKPMSTSLEEVVEYDLPFDYANVTACEYIEAV